MAIFAFVMGGLLGALCALLAATIGTIGPAAVATTYLFVSMTTGSLIIAWNIVQPPGPPERIARTATA